MYKGFIVIMVRVCIQLTFYQQMNQEQLQGLASSAASRAKMNLNNHLQYNTLQNNMNLAINGASNKNETISSNLNTPPPMNYGEIDGNNNGGGQNFHFQPPPYQLQQKQLQLLQQLNETKNKRESTQYFQQFQNRESFAATSLEPRGVDFKMGIKNFQNSNFGSAVPGNINEYSTHDYQHQKLKWSGRHETIDISKSNDGVGAVSQLDTKRAAFSNLDQQQQDANSNNNMMMMSRRGIANPTNSQSPTQSNNNVNGEVTMSGGGLNIPAHNKQSNEIKVDYLRPAQTFVQKKNKPDPSKSAEGNSAIGENQQQQIFLSQSSIQSKIGDSQSHYQSSPLRSAAQNVISIKDVQARQHQEKPQQQQINVYPNVVSSQENLQLSKIPSFVNMTQDKTPFTKNHTTNEKNSSKNIKQQAIPDIGASLGSFSSDLPLPQPLPPTFGNQGTTKDSGTEHLNRVLTKVKTKRNGGNMENGEKSARGKRRQSVNKGSVGGGPVSGRHREGGHDEDEMETLLGEIGRSVTKRRDSGFRLGEVKDPNISGIDKAEDDDPNQLFSSRQVNAPETSNERALDTTNRGDNVNPKILVQPSVQKKGMPPINNSQL